MIFDLFHSISDPLIDGKQVGAARAYEAFLGQTELAESLGFDTVWLAESHFSSETQKNTSVATIPNFFGEVGLNCDSFQFFHWIASRTKRIGLGTAIHNIVGGSGGPIASADRVNFLRFINSQEWNRTIRIGVASGRFPYQNTPFGVVPRDAVEKDFWPTAARVAFLEALEIFLRLLSGEELSSTDTRRWKVLEEDLASYPAPDALKGRYSFPVSLSPRWSFERLKLVPPPPRDDPFRVVLGSSDPKALEVALPLWDIDLFNLSFTPPAQIDALHAKMGALCAERGRQWERQRLPRTVLTFIDKDRKKARALAEWVLDAYIEAMRGTAQVPDKGVLLSRALIGDAAEIRDQLSPEDPRRLHPDDRLMLWFEFNQSDDEAIRRRMIYFAEEVAARLPSSARASA